MSVIEKHNETALWVIKCYIMQIFLFSFYCGVHKNIFTSLIWQIWNYSCQLSSAQWKQSPQPLGKGNRICPQSPVKLTNVHVSHLWELRLSTISYRQVWAVIFFSLWAQLKAMNLFDWRWISIRVVGARRWCDWSSWFSKVRLTLALSPRLKKRRTYVTLLSEAQSRPCNRILWYLLKCESNLKTDFRA